MLQFHLGVGHLNLERLQEAHMQMKLQHLLNWKPDSSQV